MIIAYRCSERGSSAPRDKTSPRWNTEANLEPRVPFCEHERIRRHQRTPDKQFLARLTACGRYTLFQLRQRQKDFGLTVPRASRLTMTPHVVHALFHYKTRSPHTPQTPTPCPSASPPLWALLSPLSILSDPGDGERGAIRLCFQLLQLLTEPPFWLRLYWGPFRSGSAIQNSAWPFFEQGSQFSMVEKSEGIYI